MHNRISRPARPLAFAIPIALSMLPAALLAQTPPGPALMPGPAAAPATAVMGMACVDGPSVQCSGREAIRTDNGVTLTASGVQVYGRSTSDLAANNTNTTGATGLALATGGLAEMRITKDANLLGTQPVLILSNLGISWDGRNERPLIAETFQPTQGRSAITPSGALVFGSLPDPADLNFYDFATKGPAGATQANYANNRYFPRANNPSRCGAGTPPASCPSTETTGPQYAAGDWRIGGTVPDEAAASRLHEDGDIHAGNATPGANGQVNLLEGASGVGVPFPGSKGYRTVRNLSYTYANVAKWLTQDGVDVVEWGNTNEHNQNRRGVLTYGIVTPPNAVPAAGVATYSGFAYGWYAANAAQEPVPFRSDAAVTVDYATRQVTVVTANSVTEEAASTPLPAANLLTAGALGASGSNVANYFTGIPVAGQLAGGLGGRVFGPATGAPPEEIGASFSLSQAGTGAVILGGFIARRR